MPARLTIRRLAAFILPIGLAFAASAQARTDHDGQAWINVTVTGTVTGRLLYFAEVQPRFDDNVSHLGTAIVRGAIGWKLSPSLSLHQGFAHIASPVEDGRDVNEERSFQQLNWTIGHPGGGELSSRTRLEQRWRSDGSDVGWRLREMLRYERPLPYGKNLNLLGYAEIFAALNDTDWGARAGFDQLRSFAGFEIPLAGKSTVELGYLNHYVNQSGGRRRLNHVASLSLFLRP